MESCIIMTCLIVLRNLKGNEVVPGRVEKGYSGFHSSTLQGWPLQLM